MPADKGMNSEPSTTYNPILAQNKSEYNNKIEAHQSEWRGELLVVVGLFEIFQ